MKTKWRVWYFWKRLRGICERKMQDAWMIGGNCDSCCPNCKHWESLGNQITTISNDDGSETRTCGNCNHQWRAIFTPAGFVPVANRGLD